MLASPGSDQSSPASERVAVVIPALNEAESIGAVIAALPRHLVDTVIVADGGSTDDTPQIARRAGAEIIAVGAGYGRACRPNASPFLDNVVAPRHLIAKFPAMDHSRETGSIAIFRLPPIRG
jgi:cellulose synthase/poly-beta-1,6-N-acetylglucosamine synthase-like glycosyltransferase